MFSKSKLLDRTGEVLSGMIQELEGVSAVRLEELNPERTVLVIMDMINGFTREGTLASPRVEALIPEVTRIVKLCRDRNMDVIAFADAHSEDSPEFDVYPPHSIKGTFQSQIVDEIAAVGGYKLIEKRSTNGYHEPVFQEWFRQHPDKDTWIIIGNCTDICVYQFATTIKTYANTREQSWRVIVPINGVDTYDGGLHFADLCHVVFLHSMIENGIEVVSGII